jgi:hypothetical protein
MEMAESNDQSAKVDRRKTRQVGWKEVRLSLAHPPGSVTPVFGATVGPPDQVGETRCAQRFRPDWGGRPRSMRSATAPHGLPLK